MKSQLIVSKEVTSFNDYFLGCGIDKVVLKLSHTFLLDQHRSRIEKNGFEIIEKKNSQNKAILLFRHGEVLINGFGYQRQNVGWEIINISFKGSVFANEDEMFMTLIRLFGDNILNAKISRLDVNFDFKIKLNEMLKGIDIKHKYKRVEYFSSSGELTSIRLGIEEPIKVYNRAKKIRSEEELTRIEFVFNLSKLRIYFNDYVKALKHICMSSKLNSVEFIETEMPFRLAIEMYDKNFKKFIQFFCIYDEYGFTQAKKIFSKNDNFYRDFNKAIGRKNTGFNLKDIFKQKTFFEGATHGI